MIGLGNYVVDSHDGLGGLGPWCDLKYPFNRTKRLACKAEKAEAKAAKKEARFADVMSMLPAKGGEIPWVPLFGAGAALIVGIWWWRSRKKA